MSLAMLLSIISLCTIIHVVSAVIYDCYTATPASADLIEKYNASYLLELCTHDINPCDPKEGSRLDGSCNNLNYPSIGTTYTKLHRILPAEFLNDTKYEKSLPTPRQARLKIIAEGSASSAVVTQLLSYFIKFFMMDVDTMQDTTNFLANTTDCCTPEGQCNDICSPIKVEADDTVHQFSGIRCMNLTKPLTFQYYGCTGDDLTIPERLVGATPLLDLSQIYNYQNGMMNEARTFVGGTLKQEEEDGKIWSPSAETPEDCYGNDKLTETRCNAYIGNGVLGSMLFDTWLWRMHNKIATELGTLNPCWNDDKLFFTSRQILIAMWLQIAFYEGLPLLMGQSNLIAAGIISANLGFRNVYNPAVKPQVSAEFLSLSDWFDTAQEGIVKMYDKNGTYVKQIPIVNLTHRFGYLAKDDHMSLITQGCIRQPGAEFDYVIDPYIAELGFGSLQGAADLIAILIARGRQNGFPSYVKYRNYFEKQKHKSFADLATVLNPGRLQVLKTIFKDVNLVDLTAGLLSEKLIPGGFMPYTLYCIWSEQLYHTVISDRHWYESPIRPHGFTAPQLQEIRKMTVARLLCDVGDSITKIQPLAFLLPSPGNKMISCDLIPKVNLLAWKDPNC